MSENVKPTTDVKRYYPTASPIEDSDYPYMVESKEGDYVCYKDYASAIEDSARAENAQRDEEGYFVRQVNVTKDLLSKLFAAESALTAAEERAKDLERGIAASHEAYGLSEKFASDREAVLSEQLNDYVDKCKDAEEQARVAEEELEAAHNEETYQRNTITRLTAEVEEWKKKAEEAYRNLNAARNDWQAEFERGIELERDLRTLRRSSVRVFSLERYIGFKAREAERELLNPSQPEIGLYILEGIESIIARRIRRSLRKENT